MINKMKGLTRQLPCQLFTLWWILVTCHSAGVTVNTWCYSEGEQSSKTISCNDKDSVLAVVRAFVGTRRGLSHNFCQFPTPSTEDCILSESAKTDDYRKQCNTFNTCSIRVDNPPKQTCESHYTGEMYLLVEHTCQKVRDKEGHFPILSKCPVHSDPVEAPSFMLYNDNYPTEGKPVDSCTYNVWSQQPSNVTPMQSDGSYVKVTIRDLAHFDTDNLACPFYLEYGQGRARMCARRGASYMTVRVKSGSQLQLVTKTNKPTGRYWLQVSADVTNGSVILQRVFQSTALPSPPSMAQTTPTQPTTSTPPTPTTQTFPPTPTTTATSARTKTTTVVSHVPTTAVPTVVQSVTGNVVTRVPVTQNLSSEGTSRSAESITNEEASTRVTHEQFTTSPYDEQTTEETPLGESELQMGIKVVIAGAVAGALIVIIVVACVAICVQRQRKPKPFKKRNDLGYSVHANLAIASKLGANAGSLRHPTTPQQKKRESKAKSSTQNVNTSNQLLPGTGGEPVPHEVGSAHMRSVALRRSERPSYRNNDNRKSRDNQKRKSGHNRKSVSKTSLTTDRASSSESLCAGQGMPGDPYAVSGVFAGFPRWADNPRSSGAEDQYDMFTSTLPAKLNKKPMPLPKPNRPVSSVLSLSPSTSPTPSSSFSFDPPDYGTAKSTDALYAVPDKKRKSRDRVVMENELYVNCKKPSRVQRL